MTTQRDDVVIIKALLKLATVLRHSGTALMILPVLVIAYRAFELPGPDIASGIGLGLITFIGSNLRRGGTKVNKEINEGLLKIVENRSRS